MSPATRPMARVLSSHPARRRRIPGPQADQSRSASCSVPPTAGRPRRPALLSAHSTPTTSTRSSSRSTAGPARSVELVQVATATRPWPSSASSSPSAIIARLGRGARPSRTSVYMKLGQVELEDHVAFVKALGPAALRRHDARRHHRPLPTAATSPAWPCSRRPTSSRSASPGAPVTDWRNYDSIYPSATCAGPGQPRRLREGLLPDLRQEPQGQALHPPRRRRRQRPPRQHHASSSRPCSRRTRRST